VVNGGDGAHQHPTQALLDSLTLRQHFGSLDGLRIAIVGDIRHSRVARSDVWAFSTLGAEVTLIAPPTLLPPDLSTWPAQSVSEFDSVLDQFDAIYLLRVQAERGGASVFPSVAEYRERFGMTDARFNRLKPDTIVLHPGPMIRGIEIDSGPADDPRCKVLEQVTNGVAVRMAVLFQLLGGTTEDE
jgi:aspartate carbamoyltransferase catalytic subunit